MWIVNTIIKPYQILAFEYSNGTRLYRIINIITGKLIVEKIIR